MLLALAAALPFYAEENAVTRNASVDIPEFLAPTVSPDEAELIGVIEDAVSKFSVSADISKFGIKYIPSDIEILTGCYNTVRYTHVEYFWLSGGYKVSYNDLTGVITKITFNYSETKEKADSDKLLIEKAAKKIIDSVRSDMTDLEKALYIHDYIALIGRYDYERYLEYEKHGFDPQYDIPESSYNLKGIILYGIGACQSYSYLYRYLLGMLGIECQVIQSTEMGHMWNIVKLGGKWYHVDVTWDDPTWDRFGRVNHTFFLCSDDDFVQSNSKHKATHYEWITKVKCDSKLYDAEIWTLSSSAVVFDANNLYISNDDGITAYKRTNHSSSTLIYSMKDKWKVQDGSYYPGSFAKLVICDSRIYFNLPTKIISMNASGGDIKTEYVSQTNIWGIVLDGYRLYYSEAADYYGEGLKELHSTGYIDIGSAPITDITIEAPSYTLGVGQRIPISIAVNEGSSSSDVVLSIKSGSQYAKIEDGMLIPLKKGSIVVRAESNANNQVYTELTVNINTVFGDANGNGEIDISDSVLLLQKLAGWTVSLDAGAIMDLNLDGVTDISDAVLLAQHLANWNVSFCTPST